MQTHKVGYLIGSLAKDSINRKLARALVRLAPAQLEMTEYRSGNSRSIAMTMMPIFRRSRELSKKSWLGSTPFSL